MIRRLAAAALLLAPQLGSADGLDLTPSQRAAFGAEIRALLLDEPGIVARALQAPDPYAAEIASDLGLIARHRDALFDASTGTVIGASSGPITLTVFTETPDATRAALAPLTQGRPALRILIRPPEPALMAALGLDITPAHVLPDRMIRGDVPAALIARYLD